MFLPSLLAVALAAHAATADDESLARSTRALLARLVEADSTNPPGNEAKLVKVGAERLREAGIPCEVYEFAPGRHDLVARLKGDGTQRPVLMSAHVVEVRQVDNWGASAPSPLDGEVPVAVGKVVAELWPDAAMTPVMSLGASDSRFLRPAGIPSYGLVTIPIFEAEGRRAHGADERLPVASLQTGAVFLRRVVEELAFKR